MAEITETLAAVNNQYKMNQRGNSQMLKLCVSRYFFILLKIWDQVFKNGPSEICGRQSLKNLK